MAPAVAVSLLLLSCKREKETYIFGYAKTYGSDVTHPKIKIELYEGVAGSGFYPGGGVKLVRTATTDINGYYSMKADLKTNEPNYILPFNKPSRYHLAYSYGDQIEIKAGQNKQQDVVFKAYCWLNIHFKNVSGSDWLGYNRGYGSLRTIYGSGYDIIQRTGNRVIPFHYGVMKDDEHARYIDTLGYVSAFDTADFQVIY